MAAVRRSVKLKKKEEPAATEVHAVNNTGNENQHVVMGLDKKRSHMEESANSVGYSTNL